MAALGVFDTANLNGGQKLAMKYFAVALPLFGAQRLTSLGYACHVTTAMPQDAIEPVRRMCKWIVDEECDPERVFPAWKTPAPG